MDNFEYTGLDYTNIIDAVVGPDENGKCKATIGMFIEEWPSNDNEDDVIDEFFLEKPIIDMTLSDDGEDEYYCIEFIYKSRRDEDLVQQWMFLDGYVKRFAEVPETAEKIPVLVLTMVPALYNGEYSVLAKAVLPETIVKVEYAGETTCSIKMLFLKSNVFFMRHGDDVLDIREIEAEARAEVEEELRNSGERFI